MRCTLCQSATKHRDLFLDEILDEIVFEPVDWGLPIYAPFGHCLVRLSDGDVVSQRARGSVGS